MAVDMIVNEHAKLLLEIESQFCTCISAKPELAVGVTPPLPPSSQHIRQSVGVEVCSGFACRSDSGFQLLVCSWDGSVAYADFTAEELGRPMTEEEKVCVLC